MQELRTRYDTYLRTSGRPDIVVDLSGVGFAGSASLGNFVALQRSVRARGGRIVFCEVDPTVAEVFRASKLESLFEFVADRATAIKAIKERIPVAPAERKAASTHAPGDEKQPPPARPSSGPLRRRNSGS